MSASLTDEQKKVLAQFRQDIFADGTLKDGDSLGTDDATLVRFLAARKFDLAESTKMIKNTQQWRKSLGGSDGIDGVYKRIDPFKFLTNKDVHECWPMWFHKTDKLGRPLNIASLGRVNMTKLSQAVPPEQHWETICVCADSIAREVFPACSQQAGRTIDKNLCIVDMKGFGMSQFWSLRGLVKDSFGIYQDHYPEALGKLIIINAPWAFTAIWNIAKPWLAKETVDKVDSEMLGTNYKDRLLELVDAENLPEELGGSCTCKDTPAGNCGLANPGPWMEGREERRRQYLAGERKVAGLEWQPPKDLEVKVDSAVPNAGATTTEVLPNGEVPSPEPVAPQTAVVA